MKRQHTDNKKNIFQKIWNGYWAFICIIYGFLSWIFDKKIYNKNEEVCEQKANSKRIIKLFVIFAVFQLIVLFIFGVSLYDNRIKNDKNTEIITGSVQDIYYDEPHGKSRHRASVYITVDGEEFFLIMTHPNTSKYSHKEIVEEIEKNDTVTATVTKDKQFTLFPNKYPAVGPGTGKAGKREIVELRENETVYYDISLHNRYVRSQTILSSVLFFIIEIISISVFWVAKEDK